MLGVNSQAIGYAGIKDGKVFSSKQSVPEQNKRESKNIYVEGYATAPAASGINFRAYCPNIVYTNKLR